MSIRRIFLVFVAPLFILLAAVNGGLLYVWERAEAEQGLEAEAIAAAVTVAAFLGTPERTRAIAADPLRAEGLKTAVARSPGLEGLWVLEAGRPAVSLAGGSLARDPTRGRAPAAPMAVPVDRDAAGPHVLGLAATADGRTVLARIDAKPMVERLAGLQRLLVGLVAIAGAIGFVLALVIARMIGRELVRNSRQVAVVGEGGQAVADDGRFRIRETRDLAAAVRLMHASVAGRMARGRRELARRDRGRSPATSVMALRSTLSPAVSAEAAGRRVAARRVGAPEPGVFVALAETGAETGAGSHAGIVLAQAEAATPADALAQAIAARRFFETHLLDGDPATRVEQAKAAFGLTRAVWQVWRVGEADPALQVLGLADPQALARAQTYATRAAGLSPDEVLDDLAALLGADGAFAVLGSRSGVEAERSAEA